MPYVNTPNKAAVRALFDRPIIERWFAEVGRPLTYFGLPGPEVHDFLEWGDLLDSQRTGVEGAEGTEAKDSDPVGRLLDNVLAHDISSGFQLLRGSIEDVIINGADDDGHPPQINDRRAVHLMRFGYDFVNLDFDGGLGYRDSRGAVKRVNALKKLFERQERFNFLFLLTVNVRHDLGSALGNYVRDLRLRHSSTTLESTIDWYLNQDTEAHLLKLVVPSLVQSAAELRGFKSLCYPPVTYVGHKRARMVHFAFELRSCAEVLRGFSIQDEVELIRLPFLQCERARLVAGQQHPEFDPLASTRSLSFLPSAVSNCLPSR